MAVSPATWLVDKSVLARLARPEVREVVLPRVQAGRIAISIVTELEIGFSARSVDDYLTTRRTLVDYLVPILIAPRAERRAREVQAELVRRGQHRAVSIPDLLMAAAAEVEQLSVLHYDADFELIASITGQPTQWVVPRGSVD
ncbi:MAG TPA: PIN domain nuclease [Actinomycetes bacterium]|nr:PIN domain nuclease [Actinomycetes bacterium]